MDPIKKLEEDIKNPDPHFRQNAVIAFGKYFEIEEERNKLKEEEKANIIRILLKRLHPEEDSIEVKGRTVKIFQKIAVHLKEAEIIQVFSSIINYIIEEEVKDYNTENKGQGKDIYVNCIKSILKKVPGSFYETIGKTIIPVLNKGLDSKEEEIIILCIDTLNDYISTFDFMLIKGKYKSFTLDIPKYIKVCLKYILSINDLLKTNCIEFLGTVGILLDKKQVSQTTEKILELYEKSKSINEKKNYILALKSLGKTSSSKQTGYFKKILEIFLVFISRGFLEANQEDYDEKNSLIEAGLNCLEIYIGTSLTNIKDKISEIIKRSIDLLDYDPNYSYENENIEIEGYDNYEDYELDANLDDSSWKVRRASSRTLAAIIKSGFNIEKDDKEKIIEKLSECLREHEENTKLEIIDCLSLYLNSLASLEESGEGNFNLVKKQSSIMNEFIPALAKKLYDVIITNLKENTSKIVISRILKLLPILAVICPAESINSFEKLKNSFKTTCFSSDENTITLIQFLAELFKIEPFSDSYTQIYSLIIDYIKKGISNPYYKVSSESINCCCFLFPILGDEEDNNKDYITSLYKDIFPKFKLQDIDYEIKVSSIKAISSFIINCGGILSEKELTDLFKIFVEKGNNDLLKSEVLTSLNNIVKNEKKLKLDKPIKELKKILLDILTSASTQIQSKAMILLSSIFKLYPNSLSDAVNNITEKLIEIKNPEVLLIDIFEVCKSMITLLSADLLTKIFDKIEYILTESSTEKNSLDSLYDFTREACQKIKQSNLKSIVKKYAKKIKSLNENISYFVSILICYSGEEKATIETALNSLTSTKEDNEINNILTLIGNVCENSKEKHDDLVGKLESIQGKLSNNSKETLSKSIGKIGVSNPDFFVQKIIKQDQNYSSLISLKEFLELIQEKNKKLSEKNTNDIIIWLLQASNLKDEVNNKSVGSCIGLLIGTNASLIPDYVKLVKNNVNEKKSSLLNGLKYIFQSKLNLDSFAKSLIELATEGIKDPDRLTKEHSLQAIYSLSKKYREKLLSLYVNGEIRVIIQNSCKIDNNYIKEADFGGGNKITEDKGIKIRRAALNIITFIIEKYYIKLNLSDTLQLMIECLLDTEDDLQNLAYSNLVKLAHENPSSFAPYGATFIDTLFKVWKRIKVEESKRNFSINVKKILEELKDEPAITENPKYNSVVIEINKH